MVSSPRPRWFQLSALNLVSKAQALADVPYVGPVLGVSKTSISGFVAVGPHCIYVYMLYINIYNIYSYTGPTIGRKHRGSKSSCSDWKEFGENPQSTNQPSPRVLFQYPTDIHWNMLVLDFPETENGQMSKIRLNFNLSNDLSFLWCSWSWTDPPRCFRSCLDNRQQISI